MGEGLFFLSMWHKILDQATKFREKKKINIQGKVGQGFEPSDLIENVPAHCRGCWTRWLFIDLFQNKSF